MKRLITALLIAGALAAPLASQTHFSQGSGSTTQSIFEAPTAAVVDLVDAGFGILRPNATEFEITKSGTYLVIGAPQVGRCAPGPPADFKFWVSVNGFDVSNSNVLLTVTKEIRDVIISQGALTLTAGDRVRFLASSSSDKACLEMQAISPPGEPLVPSLIVTLIEQ